MLIIEFYNGQGLGNQLWVYVVMRMIARKLNMPFIVLSPEKFKARDFLDIDYGRIEETESILKKVKDNQIHVFKETMYLDMELDCFCVDYDKRVLDMSPYTKMDGYFQSEKYFFDDYDFFKTLLPIKSNLLDERLVGEDTCVLNIRGGEYKNNINLILPKSYWKNAMKHISVKFNIDKFIIVTDDQGYCKELFPNLEIVKAGIAESYIALHQAKYLIVSNSSFSYFPIKTKTEKPFVIAPMYWARFDNRFKRWSSPANLYVDWNWLDGDGNLLTFDECINNYNENMNYYRTYYNICTKDDISHYFSSFTIKRYIPKPLKIAIKRVVPYRLLKEIARIVK